MTDGTNDKIKLDNVEFMANKKNNNVYSDPSTMLLDAVKNSEATGYNKAILLLLDESDGKYRLHYMASQMKCSEIITACDIMQARMRKAMGY